MLFNSKSKDQKTMEDIALVQCFFGSDIARIRATVTAMEFNLRMTRRPSTWIFVECQKSIDDCAFSWLRNHGIEYRFVQLPPESEGLMLKMSLWNIGAAMCKESRLCFVDSDVVMCDSDWIETTARKFDEGYDVLSLASFQYYQYSTKCHLIETIGHKWAHRKQLSAHAGFTLGLTRSTFEMIGGFDPSLILNDINNYYKILGKVMMKWYDKWIVQEDLVKQASNGYNVRFSYADSIACHIWHGDDKQKYNAITSLIRTAGVNDIRTLVEWDESNFDELPRWKDDLRCRILKEVLSDLYANRIQWEKASEEYGRRMGEVFGVPDETHPLVVCTTVKNGFDVSMEDFLKFRSRAEAAFTSPSPIVLFFTDVEQNERFDFASNEINTVPMKGYEDGKEFEQCMRADLKWPENAIIYYVPFKMDKYNTRIWIPNAPVHNPDGTVLTTCSGNGK